MPAAIYNFEIERGTSFYISFDYKDDTNTAINLTNWCARLRWIDPITSGISTFVTNTTNSNYSFNIDPLIGRLIFKLPASGTAALPFATASYDLELQEPNDLYNEGGKRVFRILQGTVTTISRNIEDSQPFICNTDNQDPCVNC